MDQNGPVLNVDLKGLKSKNESKTHRIADSGWMEVVRK
jgi:hypothetical protein